MEESAIADNGHDPFVRSTAAVLSACASELTRHDTQPAVKKFLLECERFVADNVAYFRVEETLARLQYSKNASAFGQAIAGLAGARSSDSPDSFVAGNLSGFRWIPEVNSLFEECSVRAGLSLEDGRGGSLEVSPVLSAVHVVESAGAVFFSEGLALQSDGREVRLTAVPAEEFAVSAGLHGVLTECSYSGGWLSFCPNDRCVMRLSLAEGTVVAEVPGKPKMTVPVDGVGKLVEDLRSTGGIRPNDMARVERFVRLVSEREGLAEIDGAVRISDHKKGISATVFVTEQGVFVQRRNPAMGLNVVAKLDPAAAIEEVRGFVGYDIAGMVKHLTDTPASALDEEIARAEEKLAAVDGLAAERGVTDQAVVERAKEAVRARIGVLLEKKAAGKKDDLEGFSPGEAAEDFSSHNGDAKKGEKLKVRSVEYTKGGPNDEIEVVLSDGRMTRTAKKNVLATA